MTAQIVVLKYLDRPYAKEVKKSELLQLLKEFGIPTKGKEKCQLMFDTARGLLKKQYVELSPVHDCYNLHKGCVNVIKKK